MNREIHYQDEPMGELKIIPDFLPRPEELSSKEQKKQITISLSSESITYFQEIAAKHNTHYQKMICQLLDEYVARQKEKQAAENP